MGKKKVAPVDLTLIDEGHELRMSDYEKPPLDTDPPPPRRKRRTKAEIEATNTVDPIALLAQAREALVKEKETLGQEIERLTARLGVIEEALASTRTA